MKKIIILSILVTILSCHKKDESIQFKDFGFSVTSWDYITQIGDVPLDLAFKLHIDNNKNLWVATYGNGLIKIGDTTEKYTTANSELPSDTFWSITSDSRGILWGGTLDGLFKFDGTTFQTFNTDNSPMTINSVHDIAVDGDDNIWFSNGHATAGGLMKFDQEMNGESILLQLVKYQPASST